MREKQNDSAIEGTVKAFFDPRKDQFRVHAFHLREELDFDAAKQLESKIKCIDTVERVHLDRANNLVQVNAKGDVCVVVSAIESLGYTVAESV